MVEEIIEVQTIAEVHQIDERRQMAETLDDQVIEQTNNMEMINEQLSSISTTIDNIQIGEVDLTEVTDKIDELDTAMITTQNQDILETLASQQDQINIIEEKVNIILQKLDEM